MKPGVPDGGGARGLRGSAGGVVGMRSMWWLLLLRLS